MSFERIVLVTQRTALEDLVLRFQTKDQARFYLDHAGQDFASIEHVHNVYRQALSAVKAAVPDTIKFHAIDRDYLPSYRFEANDLVVTLGRDGLVVNTAKYLSRQPIIPVNPDPATIDGVLLPVEVPAFGAVLDRTLKGTAEAQGVTMAEAKLKDGQSLLAVNDLFIGARSHISAHYRLSIGKKREDQSSSGIIVSTGVGSSGWLKSIYTGALGVARALGSGGRLHTEMPTIPWDSPQLFYTVREPFPTKVTGTSLVAGAIDMHHPLTVESLMPDYGVIFSDGVEKDFLEFNSGATATIGLAARAATLLVA